MKWHNLDHLSQLETIIRESVDYPIIIFKHSTSCSISYIAQRRLMNPEANFPAHVKCYFLDLLKHRDISHEIASRLQVHHESPQLILISGGECVYDSSHLDIQLDEIKEQLEGLLIAK